MGIQFFGQYLLSRGIIGSKQLLDAIEYQESQNLRLGEYAVKKGYIAEADAERINQLQQTKDLRFGEAAVELNLLGSSQVDELITAQKNDHVYLGDAVVIKGFATREQIEGALKNFKEEQARYAPEKINVPSEVPLPEINAYFFDLTQKLLLRMGGIECKLGEGRVENSSVALAGHSVQVTFSGQFNTRYFVAVPDQVAKKMGQKILGSQPLSDEELTDVVKEFANVVCGNIVAKLAQQGKQVDIGPPEPAGSSLALRGKKALVFPLATPEGEVLAAVVF